MRTSILNSPVKSVLSTLSHSRPHAIHHRSWYRIIALLEDKTRVVLFRRSQTAFTTAAIYSQPGLDNQPDGWICKLLHTTPPSKLMSKKQSTWYLMHTLQVQQIGEHLVAAKVPPVPSLPL